MKKLLLGLGTLSLAALPVLTIISCSSTPTLNTEALKLVTKRTISSGETAAIASSAIMDVAEGVDRNTVFKNYYNEVKLANGFKYDVKSAIQSFETEISVTVNVIDSRDGGIKQKQKEYIIRITGFPPGPYVSSADFKIQLDRINDAPSSIASSTTVQEVLNDIKDNNDILIKTKIIKNYMELTAVSKDYEVEYVDAIIGEKGNGTLEITFKLRSNNQLSVNKTIYVSGFKIVRPILLENNLKWFDNDSDIQFEKK